MHVRIPEKVEKPVERERLEVLPFPRDEIGGEKYLPHGAHALRNLRVGSRGRFPK
jgi:hypothetical protein